MVQGSNGFAPEDVHQARVPVQDGAFSGAHHGAVTVTEQIEKAASADDFREVGQDANVEDDGSSGLG